MKENEFQAKLIKKLKDRFPGCIVLKNDPTYKQGIPDLSIFYKNHWAMLEVKQHSNSKHRPNQDYYIDILDDMSFAKFVYPENEKEVIDALARQFEEDA